MKFFQIHYKIGKRKSSMVLEAANKLEALKQFRDKNLGVPQKVYEVSEPLSLRYRRYAERFANPIKDRRVKDEPYIAFLEQLAIMLDAGIPINTCLSDSVKNTDEPMIRAIFAEVLSNIESGQSLSYALSKFQKQLGTLTLSMFELGEQTGTLNIAVAKLAAIFQQMHDNRRMLKKATRYPLFIITAMGIAFVVVITFVVPQFQAFFTQSGLELPFPTKVLLWTEHAIRLYGPYILGAALLLAAGFNHAYKTLPALRLKTDRYWLKVYIVGKVTYYAMIGRFIYLFDALSDAGIPMKRSLEIAASSVDNTYLRQDLQKIAGAIDDGRSLAQGFGETGQFEGMIVQMVRTGESSGSLGKMLRKITQVYASRYTYIVDNITAMIEPVLITAIAGFVLILALGIFLPMWSMVELAG